MIKRNLQLLRTCWALLLLAAALAPLSTSNVKTTRGASQTVVEVNPSTTPLANVSTEFAINITVMDVQNLYAVEVTLNWNSSVLALVNVDVRLGQPDGVLYEQLLIPPNSNVTQPGSYSLAATSEKPAPPFNGSGTIVKLTFEVLTSTNSSLDLESQLYDYIPPNRDPPISLPIDHTTIGGLFGTSVPETTSNPLPIILLVILVLLALSILAIVVNASRKKTKSHLGKESGQH